MAVIKHIQHVRSNELSGTSPKSPTSGDVQYGEIAINYHSGTETIFLRNDEDEIVTFKPGGLVGVVNTDSALTVSTTDGQSTINSALWELSSTSGVTAKYAYANTATGAGSLAEGRATSASGIASHAEGYQTSATGSYSHAEGYSTSTIGQGSHAEGYSTRASGLSSHAEGYSTSATGSYSHAEGNSTRASGLSSHAEGGSNRANSNYCHAGGGTSTATGVASFAHGSGVSTGYDCETAFGKYNARSTGSNASAKTYFSVGIGTSSSAKKNALEIRSNGDIYITTGNTATAAGTATLLQTELTVWNCGDYA